MRHSKFTATMLAAALLVASATAMAQTRPTVDLGKQEYESNCVGCHGRAGKGDGPYLLLLAQKEPADLTTLSRRNKGVFPYQRVYEVIDGRQELRAHGPRDMPIWGLDYRAGSHAYPRDEPYDPEAFVRSRILALVDYINRLQQR